MAKRKRASVACFRCKANKVKCADYRPCKRCADGGFECSGSPGHQINTDGQVLIDQNRTMMNSSGFADNIYPGTQILRPTNEEKKSEPGPSADLSIPFDMSRTQQLLPGLHSLFAAQTEISLMHSAENLQSRNFQFALPISMPAMVSSNTFLPPCFALLNSTSYPYPCASTQQFLARLHRF